MSQKSIYFKNPFIEEGNWYKANLHTHTTTSDGRATPQERVEQYKNAGYHIIALTDHNATNDISGLSSKDFLVISGTENHLYDEVANEDWHLVCLNVPHGFEATHDDINARIQKVQQVGGEVIVGHPYECGFSVETLLKAKDAIGIEVFNGTSDEVCKSISSVHWDNMLDRGRWVSAIAADDSHTNAKDMFLGWTMIKAKELNVESIMQALREGSFYSSSGPTIEKLNIVDDMISIECSPVVQINVVGNRYLGRKYKAEIGQVITNMDIQLRIPKWAKIKPTYYRIEIVDQYGNRAWTNPFHWKVD